MRPVLCQSPVSNLKKLEDEMNAVSEDDEEELEDPYHNSGSSDEDYCRTKNYVEDSSQSDDELDVPNMNSNTNDLKDNNETSNSSTGISESDKSEDEQVVNNTIRFNNNGVFIRRLILLQQKSVECSLPCELKELDLSKDTEATSGALEERIVKNLASSLRGKAVALCFDRFFASVKLLNELNYPAV
ncbi:hypothetical protein ILUMI_21419 [Ignelater luminosus]|uniref:PiggyBac transposable element-derived protein domain-containing protein n=1 Tax=Ignelater luminosus TaxID=2038154 RepID=A0A8K0G3Q2_IGNLU|nr:hypothetical protein ILUMI_21419 [Ignelater luminosus]